MVGKVWGDPSILWLSRRDHINSSQSSSGRFYTFTTHEVVPSALFSERYKEAKYLDKCAGHSPGSHLCVRSIHIIWGAAERWTEVLSLAMWTLTEFLSTFSLVKYSVIVDKSISFTLGNLLPCDCGCLQTDVLHPGLRTYRWSFGGQRD